MEPSSVILPTNHTIGSIWKLLVMCGALLCLNCQVISGERYVNYTVNGWSVPVCPPSGLCNVNANAECSSPNPNREFATCKCDPACYFFTDCCIDYFLNCDTITPSDTFTRAAEEINSNQLSCIYPNRDGGKLSEETSHYLMVAKCSHAWIDRLNISSKCEGPSSVDDPLSVLHVIYLNSISFKNVYCAVCNYRNLGDVRPWGFDAACFDGELKNVSASEYTVDQMELAMETCWGWELEVPSSSPTAARECESFGLAGTCDAGTEPSLTEACESYTGTVDFSTFKNPHCYYCSMSNLYDKTVIEMYTQLEYNSCPQISLETGTDTRPPPHGTFPISVLFDFTNVEGLNTPLLTDDSGDFVVSCTDYEVLDPFSLKCVNLTCPAGYILINKACVQQSSQNACTNISTVPTSVHIDCLIAMFSDSQQCQASSSIANELISTFIKPLELGINTTSSEVKAFLLRNESCLQSLDVFGFLDLKTEIPFTSYDKVIFSLAESANAFNISTCNISSFEMILGCADIEHACSSGLISLEGIERFFDDESGLWFKDANNKTHEMTNSLYTLRYSMADSHLYSRYEFLEVCPRVTCPLVAMNASLFERLHLGDLVFIPYNLTLAYDQYVYFDNQTIYICSSIIRGGDSLLGFLNFSPAQSLLTVVGLSLSIAALFLTLMTYIQFSRLSKSTSNFLIISLCFSLISAQLFFLLMVPASFTPKACVSVAILGHFMWLSVFSHSTSLAFDLHRRFSVTVTIGTADESTRALIKFLSFAWGSPLLIVIPCIGVFFGQVDIPNFNLSYGQSACWIGDGLANLYVFGIPIAVLIVINTALFAMVVIGLHRVRRNVAAIQNKSNESLMWDDLLIYIKMSTLLGFTWVFGFIAALADVAVLWYVFIALNSLQGVYIFIAFVCTKKGLRVWRDFCLCGPSTSGSSSSSGKHTSHGSTHATRTESMSMSKTSVEMKTG